MAASQILLFPDPSPLVERLGRDFFRQLPEGPGIYLMRGAADALLYVGKAKNLRKRLGSYRVANPDRMPRRHLRLLRAVERIEIQECASERAALEREAELLRTLRPRFNRAGTWTGTPKYFAWRLTETGLEMAVITAPTDEWRTHQPMGAGAWFARAALLRLLWFAMHPEKNITQLPAGWFRGFSGECVALKVPADANELGPTLEKLLSGDATPFAEWLAQRLSPNLSPFEMTVVQADLEFVEECFI